MKFSSDSVFEVLKNFFSDFFFIFQIFIIFQIFFYFSRVKITIRSQLGGGGVDSFQIFHIIDLPQYLYATYINEKCVMKFKLNSTKKFSFFS